MFTSSFKTFKALLKKECWQLIDAPSSIIFSVLFFMLLGYFSFVQYDFIAQNHASMQHLFSIMPWILLLFCSSLTMNSFAGEYQTGTYELLSSMPIKDSHLIGAKFLAPLFYIGAILLLSMVYWAIISFLGNPDHFVIICSYAVLCLLAAFFLALGTFIGVICHSPIATMLLTLSIGLFFMLDGFHWFSALLTDYNIPLLPTIIQSLGGLQPLEMMQKTSIGMVDYATILLHILSIVLCLVGAVIFVRFYQKNPSNFIMRRYAVMAITGLMILLVPAGFVIKWATHNAYFDATSERKFTHVNPFDHTSLELKEPLTLSLYFSKRLLEKYPAYEEHYQYIRGILDNLQARYPGKITIKTVHPTPFSKSEDDAILDGMTPIPLDNSGETVFFGLAFSHPSQPKRFIPFFNTDYQDGWALAIYKNILRMNDATKPKIAIITDYQLFATPPSVNEKGVIQNDATADWAIIHKLRLNYDVVRLSPLELLNLDRHGLKNNFAALLLLQPPTLSQNHVDIIRHYFDHGGKIITVLDPLNLYAARYEGRFFMPKQEALLGFLKKDMGVIFDPDMIAGDSLVAQQVTVRSQHHGQHKTIADLTVLSYGDPYATWAALPGTQKILDPQNHPNAIQNIMLLTSGMWKKYPGDKEINGDANDAAHHADGHNNNNVNNANHRIDYLPLLTTTTSANNINVLDLTQNGDPIQVFNQFTAGDIPLDLAVLCRQHSRVPPLETASTTSMRASTAVGEMILLGDLDMLYDSSWQNPPQSEQASKMGALLMDYTDNALWFGALLDGLLRHDSLHIWLKQKQFKKRPLSYVQNIKKEAEKRFAAREARLIEKMQLLRGEMQNKKIDPGHLAQLRTTFATVRQDLRAVQYELRRDIQSIQKALYLFACIIFPMLIAFLLFGFRLLRRSF